ncbi:MAG: hypothetical protein ABEJ56_05910 [Candidatus Nanohaloarchaea archaeon]
MKFQLFGRLRDNEDQQESGSDIGGDFSQGMDQDSGMESLGGGLQRTVEDMFSQGYSEEEVRQELQGQYSMDEIQDAINQAVKSSATSEQGGPEPMTPYQGSNENVSPMDEGYGNDDSMNEKEPIKQDQQPQNPMGSPQQAAEMDQGMGRSGNVEEMVETIVAENFEDVEKEFENAYSEIDDIKQKLNDLEDRVEELEIRDDEDQTEFIQKMDDLEEDINQYQSRIGGLEKAFQQVLPSLVDNVRDLTNLVQEIKQERGIETESDVSEDDIEDMDMEDW